MSLIALAFAAGSLLAFGFTTEFAKTTVSCGSPVAEAMPEDEPAGPSEEEAEYLRRTGNLEAMGAYNSDQVAFLEERACGDVARRRVWKYALGAIASWSVGAALVKSGFRRRPKSPSIPTISVPKATG